MNLQDNVNRSCYVTQLLSLCTHAYITQQHIACGKKGKTDKEPWHDTEEWMWQEGREIEAQRLKRTLWWSWSRTNQQSAKQDNIFLKLSAPLTLIFPAGIQHLEPETGFNPVLIEVEGEFYAFLFVINGFKLGTVLCNRPFDALRPSGEILSLFLQPRNLAVMKGEQHGGYFVPSRCCS